jgi:NAD(P)-dependent dehydrogenase (short-subunit alcohol dehydrogenase family)
MLQPGAIRFDRQAAIVTGAAGGIGKAIARELALRGACILVNDLYADGGQHVAGPVLSPGRFR